MSPAEEIADFAALLRELKQRSGLSYEAVAKRAHMSTSTLHRYCKGEGVPADNAAVSRFARVCGATPEELVELHRRWVLADAARERARRAAADPEPPSAQVRTDRPSPEAAVPARRMATFLRTARRRWALVAAGTAVAVAVSTALTVGPEDREADLAKTGRPGGTGASATPPPSASASSSVSVRPSVRPSARTSLSPSPTSPPAPEPSGAEPSVRGTDTSAHSPDPGRVRDGGAVPLTVSTRTYAWDDPQCEGKYLINRPPGEVSPPVMGQDVPGWLAAHGAVAADTQRVALTVQGTGDATVVIESLHVRVVDSTAPPAWNAYLGASGCGGGVETRSFDTDLDAAHPAIAPKAGQRGVPYKVSRSDPEVLYITAHARAHDVKWYVELQWSSGGRQGTTRIDDHGQPFRTSGSRGRPVHEFLLGGTEWFTVAEN
ncbi:helix-turn-helix transcriptional regulator [Streptomyces sp. JV176]|uniref:helix-turn-helix domain-containing protein n=1 Tax=Streptomyces sp. JV176 TaxID=858630 RepID=UPI002E7825AB|nr:helix-turn-helix transcriptional regulator [Streptomyces sp. JV176]MEE1803523.1 helix-turn-helix transcriptional regulator [Streptomyces sp. JV176]